MTYQFYVNPTVASGTTINQTVTLYWSNTGPTGSWSDEVAKTAQTVNCSFAVSKQATWARVSSFAAREESGRVALEWETAAEVGTVAFGVERLDAASGRFVPVAERAVPAVAQLPGGRYRLIDTAAPRGQKLTYRLVEVDQKGAREVFGPYRVTVERERPSGLAKDQERDFTATGKPVSPRLARASQATAKAAPAATGTSTTRRARVEVSRSGQVRVHAQDLASALGSTLD